MRLIEVAFLLLPVRGCLRHAGQYYHVYSYDMKASKEAPHLPLPLLLHFNYSSEWRGYLDLLYRHCLLVYLNFPSFKRFIRLTQLDKRPVPTPVAKFIPNWNFHYFVSQQTEFTQSVTRPTLISDLIIIM